MDTVDKLKTILCVSVFFILSYSSVSFAQVNQTQYKIIFLLEQRNLPFSNKIEKLVQPQNVNKNIEVNFIYVQLNPSLLREQTKNARSIATQYNANVICWVNMISNNEIIFYIPDLSGERIVIRNLGYGSQNVIAENISLIFKGAVNALSSGQDIGNISLSNNLKQEQINNDFIVQNEQNKNIASSKQQVDLSQNEIPHPEPDINKTDRGDLFGLKIGYHGQLVDSSTFDNGIKFELALYVTKYISLSAGYSYFFPFEIDTEDILLKFNRMSGILGVNFSLKLLNQLKLQFQIAGLLERIERNSHEKKYIVIPTEASVFWTGGGSASAALIYSLKKFGNLFLTIGTDLLINNKRYYIQLQNSEEKNIVFEPFLIQPYLAIGWEFVLGRFL